LLKILGFEKVSGNLDSCLNAPRKVAISESTAAKYFGKANPIGKTLSLNKTMLFEISAVYQDRPKSTHFKPDIIISMATLKQANPKIFVEGWFNSGFYTYVKVRDGVDPKNINRKIAEFVDKELGETLRQYKVGLSYQLQPLKDIHLTSHLMHEIEPNGDKQSMNLLKIVAWFILIIAWVNFFNLTTISSIKRIREIGVRKVNGASRRNLVFQFLAESAMVNIVAVVGSLILFEIFQSPFAYMSGLPEHSNLISSKWYIGTIVIAFLVGTFSAGIYSVTKISSSKLMDIVKGTSLGISKNGNTKRALVVFQFAMAIALIAGTLGVYSQYRYMKNRDLGFRKDQLIIVKAPLVGDTSLIRKLWVFEQEVKELADVKGISFSSMIPGKPNMYNRGGIYRKGDDPNNSKNYRITEADSHYIDVYGLNLLAGKGFAGIPSIDRNLIVLNNNAARLMGFEKPEDAIGKEVVIEGLTVVVAGVVADYFQQSPKEPIEPQIFRYPKRFQGYFSINMDSKETRAVLGMIESTYKMLFPNNPFDYFYLNQFYDKQFQYEKRFGIVFVLFSLLSMFITVLGLLALSSYTAEMRRKEIGIRKVLGSSVPLLIKMLYKEYILMLIVASALALPLVYYFLIKWLDSFALKMSISLWIFIIPVAIVVLLSALTVIFQSYRVATENPINSLKYE